MRQKNPILIELGGRIREIRKLRGWSQEAFAAQCEIDRSYMGGIERGERNITFTMLLQIARTLNVDAAEIVRSISTS